MTVIWSPQAADDFEEAVAYLTAKNPGAAEKLANGILGTIERLATQPLDGPEHLLETGESVRGWPYPPFRVYYQRTANALLVVRVYHQKQQPIER